MNVRELAVHSIMDINERKAYIKPYLESLFKKQDILQRDKAWLSNALYGVTENQIFLDSIIASKSKVKFSKIMPVLVCLLRLGIYELLFSHSTPPYAIVNESVKLSSKFTHRAGQGFVNGVLRSVAREGINLLSYNKDLESLATRFSHPKWLVEKLLDCYGIEKTISLLEINNSDAKLFISFNLLRGGEKELKQELESLGYILESTTLSNSYEVINTQGLFDTEPFKQGKFYVQNPSASLSVRILKPSSGDRVLDSCAAPGTKSIQAAIIMDDTGDIVSSDLYEERVSQISRNKNRLGLKIVKPILQDATQIRSSEVYDKAIIDVPCTGTGVLRKNPEGKLRLSEEDLNSLTKLQYEILTNSCYSLKIGGYALYSTCSILKEENTDIVDKFISNNNAFCIEPIEFQLLESVDDKGTLTVFPDTKGWDGFFVALIRRLR